MTTTNEEKDVRMIEFQPTLTQYKLRITFTEDCSPENVLDYLKSKFQFYSYVKEKGKQEEKEHCHCYILTDMKNDTMRSQIRKLSKSSSGNKLFSLKKISLNEGETFPIEYMSYMMKEGEVIYSDIPEEWKAIAREHDDRVKNEIKIKKEKKKSRYQRIMEGWKKIERQDFNCCVDYVIDFLRQERTGFSVNTINQWVCTIMCEDEEFRQQINVKIHQTMFPKTM